MFLPNIYLVTVIMSNDPCTPPLDILKDTDWPHTSLVCLSNLNEHWECTNKPRSDR